MKFRNLDTNDDFTLGKGLNDYVRDDEAIKLNIKTRLLSWKNDCFFAQNDGVDWYNRLGSKSQRELLEAEIKIIILQTPDVVELVSFYTELTGRAFTAQYNIKTVNSPSVQDKISIGE